MCRTGWLFYTSVTSHFTMIDCPFCTTGWREQRERWSLFADLSPSNKANAVQRTRPDKAIANSGPNRPCSHVERENRKIYFVKIKSRTLWNLLYLHWNMQKILQSLRIHADNELFALTLLSQSSRSQRRYSINNLWVYLRLIKLLKCIAIYYISNF